MHTSLFLFNAESHTVTQSTHPLYICKMHFEPWNITFSAFQNKITVRFSECPAEGRLTVCYRCSCEGSFSGLLFSLTTCSHSFRMTHDLVLKKTRTVCLSYPTVQLAAAFKIILHIYMIRIPFSHITGDTLLWSASSLGQWWCCFSVKHLQGCSKEFRFSWML